MDFFFKGHLFSIKLVLNVWYERIIIQIWYKRIEVIFLMALVLSHQKSSPTILNNFHF